MKTSHLTALIFIIQNVYAEESRSFFSNDKVLNFTELASKYGYKSEEHSVVTDDGYILSLFHIRGRRGFPVFLMHATADTSDSWLLRGDTSLGITLAKKEYDIWFGNVRGNKYSRRHITLDPDEDSLFWDFSFHEHGYYDLPAMIDKVLSITGAPKINGIGHSQGNTMFYVLGSLKPEYNRKVNVLMALAPICYLSNLSPPVSSLIKVAPELNAVVKALDMNELFGDETPSGKVIDILCNKLITRYPTCALGILFPLFGFDITEFGPKFFDIAMKHFPSSTTRKNLNHYAQVSRRHSFASYDYGPSINLKLYNSTMPPDYDLTKIRMPIVLIAGKNDKLSILSDVARLREELPNVENYILVERDLMNHLDYAWGANMEDYLFPHIFDVLEKEN